MKINKAFPLHSERPEEKKRGVPCKKNFQEAVDSDPFLKKPQKKKTPFDLASEKADGFSSKKKQDPLPAQHGEVPPPLFFAPIEKGSEIDPFFPKDLSVLMEKIAQFIQIESQKGVTTTTVTLDVEGSIFNGSQITLQHYDTAPHSFNIQLSGSPEGVDLFNTHLTSLQLALLSRSALQETDIRILPPILNETSHPSFEKVKGKKERSLKKRKERQTQKISS